MGGALGCQRAEFFLPRDVHYLNCAYMGPLPRASEAAGIAGLRRKCVPTGIGADDFFSESEELRRLFAALVGAESPRRIAIQPGASYGIAVAARNLPLARGQSVVLVEEQFPGSVLAWRRRAAESGARIRTVGPGDGPRRGASWNERLLDSIDRDTAVVCVPHVHWTDGTRFDLVEVGGRCRDMGAALVVDGTQSIGALPFDVAQVRPDALVCAAYKWLLGPYSLALAYYSERFDDGVPLEETWIGRAGSEDFQALVLYEDAYQPGALRYDVAERSNFALLPVAVASLRLVSTWGPARVQAYCEALTGELLEGVASLGFSVEERGWRAAHLFGLRMPEGLDLKALAAALAARSVIASLRGTALRLSPNVYNDREDVEALLHALREAVDAR